MRQRTGIAIAIITAISWSYINVHRRHECVNGRDDHAYDDCRDQNDDYPLVVGLVGSDWIAVIWLVAMCAFVIRLGAMLWVARFGCFRFSNKSEC